MIDDTLAKLLRRMRPFVSGRTGRNFRARFETSDIMQEAAIQLLADIEKTGGEGYARTDSFLARVGRGHAFKLWRFHTAAKRNVQREDSPVDARSSEPTPDELAAAGELSANLAVALGKLDAEERLVVNERIKKGHSFNYIAEIIDRPPHWVRRKYRRAIAQLRAHLTKQP